jgi:hypothetical protein
MPAFQVSKVPTTPRDMSTRQVSQMALCTRSQRTSRGDDRMEAKLDALLRAVRPEDADKLIKHIDDLYLGRETDKHTEYHRHWE